VKPVDMTILGRQGDCWRACIASIVEVPIEVVPHFMLDADLDGGGWAQARAATDLWLAERYFVLKACRAEVELVSDLPLREGEMARFMVSRLTYCQRRFPEVRERYGIITGTTERYNADYPLMHSVVADLTSFAANLPGWLAHDPHPSRAGVLLVQDLFTVAPLPLA